MLAAAPFGRVSRRVLQETLWGATEYDTGHQNLRRALSDLRRELGPAFDSVLTASLHDIELDLSRVRFVHGIPDGTFLDGMALGLPAFDTWVAGVRADPSTVRAQCRAAPEHNKGARVLPRITVIPFLNIGGGDAARLLGDWAADQICRALSRSHLIEVISHLSSRSFAGQTLQISDVQQQLDVDYVVVGTLRQVHDKMVLDIDMLEAETGRILWTRDVTVPADRIAEVLPEALAPVIRAVGDSLYALSARNAMRSTAFDMQDRDLVMGGVALMHRPEFLAFAKSRDLLQEAVNRAPQQCETHAWLGKWYILSVFNGWSTDRVQDTQRAFANTSRALEMDPQNAFALTIDGFAHNNLGRAMETSALRYELAIDSNPNESLAWLLRGALMAFQDEGAAAISAATRARKLSPVDPFGYYYDSLSSTAHLAANDYTEALRLANRSLARNDRHLSTIRAKITALHYLDRGDEARETARDLLRRMPDFTLDGYRRTHPSASHKLGQKALVALAAAGIQ